MKRLLPFIFLGLTVFLITPGYANWGGGGDGNIGTGNFNAMGTGQVEMVHEDLNIELYRDRAKVRVEYLLHNTGEAVNTKAGFPSLTHLYREEKNIFKNLEIEAYRILVSGKEVPYHLEKGAKANWVQLPDYLSMEMVVENPKPIIYWLVSTVRFNRAETKKITIAYESLYQSGADGVSGNLSYYPDSFYYFLSTGAAWKGPIQSGTVHIKAVTVEPKRLLIKPEGRFKRDGNIFTWNIKDLEPTIKDNIEISLNNGYESQAAYLEDGGENYIIGENDGKYYFDFNRYTVEASSTLENNSSYAAKNVADQELSTAWVEGAKGDGVGEYLTLTLEEPTKVHKVGIMPGYAKSKEIYFANNRVAELKVVINGSVTITRSFFDDYTRYHQAQKAYQFFDLGNYKQDIKTLKLIITKVYRGSKYNDTCISEIILRKQLDKVPEHRGAR